MPSPWPWRSQWSSWPSPPLQPATQPISQAGPERQDRRSCGCTLDPVVFGHTAWNGHRYPEAGAA